MKRILSSLTAATIVLGASAVATTAMASTGPKFVKETITVGKYQASPSGFAALDGKSQTTYMPIWYVMQGLKAMGYTVSWDGTKNELNIVAPNGVSADLTNVSAGHGSTSILLNGKVVQKVNARVAKDPASGVTTTYMPIWYVQQVMQRVDINSSWKHQVWALQPGSQYAITLFNNDSYGPSTGIQTVNKNVIVLGSNTTLQNTVVNGDVYLSPGPNGTASLKGVTVKGNIYVESGANHSIDLQDVTANTLSVDSTSPVHIISAGKTSIQQTQVTSKDTQPVSFDNEGGAFGTLYIQSGQDITLTGSVPYENIAVESGAHVTVAAGVKVMNLTVNASNAAVTIASGASVDAVNVKTGNNVQLSVDGTINTLSNLGTGTVSLTGKGNVATVTGTGVSGSTSGTAASSGTSSTGSSSSSSSSNSNSGGVTISSVTPGTAPSGQTLATPTGINVNGAAISWNPVLDATGYSVSVTDSNNHTSTYDRGGNLFGALNQVNLNQFGLSSGQYTVTVAATGSDSSYESSNPSTTQSVYINQLETPSNLQVNGTVASWDPVPNAVGYIISMYTVSGQASPVYHSAQLRTTPSIDLSTAGLLNGTYEITVQAISSDLQYSISDESSYSPNIMITNSTYTSVYSAVYNVSVDNQLNLSWDAVPNATEYEIDLQNPNEPGFNFTEVYNAQDISTNPNTNQLKQSISDIPLASGSYNVLLRAASPGLYADSGYSTAVPINVHQLPAPSGVTMNGNQISWQPVANATGYEINLLSNDQLTVLDTIQGGSNTSVNLSNESFSGISSGTYTLTVSAMGDGYSQSLGSSAGSFNVSW
ncbi:hypothetical protein [Alicyclobacillus dauci]|uniref:Copper amine oxidase N-terminal domain-containing protein n=1 Tax=Alicyclobacillus dauci TaxID=1475485 RepID=A0ABY6Z3N8_9BACL|nr:hypothetical protein [Alicyclobacillus dauci]WAH36821.1 copper amine oxidase N-terminal domain-containing protein [Alicyclobacillus dauci]